MSLELPVHLVYITSVLLAASAWTCAQFSGGSVSSQQHQEAFFSPTPCFQSHDSALPVEGCATTWWLISVSTPLWVQWAPGESGGPAQAGEYNFFLSVTSFLSNPCSIGTWYVLGHVINGNTNWKLWVPWRAWSWLKTAYATFFKFWSSVLHTARKMPRYGLWADLIGLNFLWKYSRNRVAVHHNMGSAVAHQKDRSKICKTSYILRLLT